MHLDSIDEEIRVVEMSATLFLVVITVRGSPSYALWLAPQSILWPELTMSSLDRKSGCEKWGSRCDYSWNGVNEA